MATVLVRGSAQADVDPDRVRLTVTISAEAAAGPAALAGLAERSTAAAAVLDAYPGALLARRPAGVSLQPHWGQDGEILGQAAQRTLVVEARADGPLGELLTRLVDVPGTTVAGAAWLVDDTNPARSRLRAAAVAEAHARATDYALAAGLRLGALDRIAEPGLSVGDPASAEWMPMSAKALGLSSARDTGFSGGPVLELRPEPVNVTAEIDVRWALLD